MVSTRVGYAGGEKKNPTYRSIGDHTETIQIDFDPKVTSYRQLLEIFWKSHDPAGRAWSRQYMNAVFVHDEKQRKLAEETAPTHKTVRTQILPFTGFTLAEDYHQKYSLRRLNQVERELEAMYPELDDFVRSTAATRINALAGGGASARDLERIEEQLGLSEEALKELRRVVR